MSRQAKELSFVERNVDIDGIILVNVHSVHFGDISKIWCGLSLGAGDDFL